MAFKMIVGFVVALAAVGADALACRPDSSSVVLSFSTLTTSTPILETSSTTTVSSEELTTVSTETTASITSSSTEESTSASTTSIIIISTTTESRPISTAETTTTTTSITIPTSEEPTSSTTSSVPAPCPTEGLICGDDSYVRPRPGLKYTNIGVISVEACTAACREVADCYFFLINRGSKMCTLYTMSKQEAPLQKIRGATYIAYERGCFVC
ncbi:hypothetical protein CEP54_012149 [Fusarium duplospermum]|uniref:Apple domain-containing protein n=1 Tax=Fusarium duplospermum TaxID=1325734 RepID=A0A428PA97_9HYPO|nr:hypothetical protein CEP54_012149 [Fusarium duplospermum]